MVDALHGILKRSTVDQAWRTEMIVPIDVPGIDRHRRLKDDRQRRTNGKRHRISRKLGNYPDRTFLRWATDVLGYEDRPHESIHP